MVSGKVTLPISIHLQISSNVKCIQGRKVHNENFTTFLGPAQDCWLMFFHLNTTVNHTGRRIIQSE